MKDYLVEENGRNHQHRSLYTALMREALGHADEEIVIGHHLTYDNPAIPGEEDPIEIPSADTFIFCHDMAKKLWGDGYLDVLAALAREPVETRDDLLAKLFAERSIAKAA